MGRELRGCGLGDIVLFAAGPWTGEPKPVFAEPLGGRGGGGAGTGAWRRSRQFQLGTDWSLTEFRTSHELKSDWG